MPYTSDWFSTAVAREPAAAEDLEVWPAPCVVCWSEKGEEFVADSREEGLAHRKQTHPWLHAVLDQMRTKEVPMTEFGEALRVLDRLLSGRVREADAR